MSLKSVPEFETLRLDVENELGLLTLDRPDRLNAINAEMLHELVLAARWFDDHLEVRVVLVRGAGRAFSSGADVVRLPSTESGSSPPWQERREVGQRGLRAINALEQMRAITIGLAHGYAVGGGLLVLTACDLRLAASDAVFFIPEVELGIPLAWGGIPRLVREVGPALTKELVMTCRRFSAQEAKEAGLLNRVVEADALEAEGRSLAESLLRMPAGPLVQTKDHVNAVAQAIGPGLTAFADGDLLLGALADPDGQAARRRYLEEKLGKKA